jgi:hypothetical protein
MHNVDQVKLARRGRMQLISVLLFAALTILGFAGPVWIEEVSGNASASGFSRRLVRRKSGLNMAGLVHKYINTDTQWKGLQAHGS